jgi:hypothetical protein
MHVDEAVDAVTTFSKALADAAPDLTFRFEMHSSNGPLRKCFRKEIPTPGATRKSGVYFITDPEKEILYIGKATAGNLGAEIYGKFCAAVITDPAADVARFEPAELSSLVEVYLHTSCQLGKSRVLPPLNKRIG